MTLMNASQLTTSPVEELVAGILPRVAGLGIWWGESHIGKSLTVDNELALAVGNGRPFFGHETIQGNVVLALGEGTADAGVRMACRIAREERDRRARAAAITAADGAEAAQAYLAALKPYNDKRIFIEDTPFRVPLTRTRNGLRPDPEMIQTIDRWSAIPDLELVILDALPDFSGGESITNDTMANRYVLGLKYLVSELQCLVLCVNHATARGDKMMGGVRFFNAADFVAHLARDATEPGEPDGATITCEKSKYLPKHEPMTYQIEEHQWWEPPADDQGNPTGEPPELVKTASVRLHTDDSAGSQPALTIPPPPGEETDEIPAGRVLPVIEDVPPGRKPRRTGFRSVRPAVIPGAAADPGEAADEAARVMLVAGLLTPDCPVCPARTGLSCPPGIEGRTVVVLDQMPLVLAHPERIEAAVTAGVVSQDDVLAQFYDGAAPSELAGARG